MSLNFLNFRCRGIPVVFDFSGKNEYNKFYRFKKEVNVMPQSAVSAKGQITLPLAYRKKYGINSKDLVTIEDSGEAIIIRKARNFLAMEGILGAASTVAPPARTSPPLHTKSASATYASAMSP